MCLQELDIAVTSVELASASSLATSAVTDDVQAPPQVPMEGGDDRTEQADSERHNVAPASAPVAETTPRLASPAGVADAESAAEPAVASVPLTVTFPGGGNPDVHASQPISTGTNGVQQAADAGLQASSVQEEQTQSECPQQSARGHAEERQAWIAAAATDAMTPEAQERVALEQQLRSIQEKVDASQKCIADALPPCLNPVAQLHC